MYTSVKHLIIYKNNNNELEDFSTKIYKLSKYYIVHIVILKIK